MVERTHQGSMAGLVGRLAGMDSEVRKCVAMSCPNWPFRMNKNPWRAPMQLTDEDRERRRERGLALAAGRAQKTVSDK